VTSGKGGSMDQLSRLADLRKQQIEESKMSRNEKNKERFKNICRKKFQTCFIFPIAEFEETFGKELWGNGLQDSELTEKQKLNKLKWDRLRKNVLDKGNGQLRAFLSEIELYNIIYQGYKTNFIGTK
jgi:hypothetical protein